MKKTLSQLTIGDNLHVIVKNKPLLKQGRQGDYHYHDGIIHEDIPITRLEQVEEDGNKYLLVNPRWVEGSWGSKKRVCILKLDENEVRRSSCETEERIYFTNEEDRDALMRGIALKEIARFEKEIEDYTQARIRDIEEVRKNYFRVLNPSLNIKKSK